MKTFASTIVFMLLAINTIFAQNFYVIKVEGKILCENTELKTSDKLSSESVLHFTEPENKIYLLSPSDGYFMLTSEEQDKTQKSWIVELKNAIIPQNKYYKTATRGDNNNFDSFDDVYDLMAFFRDNVLIIDKTEFWINPEKIILNDTHYFEFESTSGKEKINYKQTINSFSISIDFEQAGYKMFYIQNKERLEIGNFKLRYMKRETMEKELNVFFSNQNLNKSTAIYFEQIKPYISNVYGNTNWSVIREIIEKDMQVPLMVND